VTDFVLDDSVTMRWCFDAGSHAYADSVLAQLEADEGTAFVPIMWRYEVSAVLARAEIKGFLPAHKAPAFIENLAALPIEVDPESASRILTDVHQLAIQYCLSSYDAAYLELALRRNLPLATLDEELREACKAAGVAVL